MTLAERREQLYLIVRHNPGQTSTAYTHVLRAKGWDKASHSAVSALLRDLRFDGRLVSQPGWGGNLLWHPT